MIRRFIDPEAQFLFAEESALVESAPRENAIPFDAPRLPEIKLNHRGERCTFEAIPEDFKIEDTALQEWAVMVRAADIRGQEQVAPEGAGLNPVTEGFRAMGLSGEERLQRQFPVYDAPYQYVLTRWS